MDTAIVTRPMDGYALYLRRDFIFTATGADGTIEFYGDPQGRLRTLSAHVVGSCELGAALEPGVYTARMVFKTIELTPRARYMVDLLASGACGPAFWQLNVAADVLGTGGCQPLGFVPPVYDRARFVGRELIFGSEPPLTLVKP